MVGLFVRWRKTASRTAHRPLPGVGLEDTMRIGAAIAIVIAALGVAGCAETPSGGEARRAAEISTSSNEPPSEAQSEGPGSRSHAGDEQFCSSHRCIANFPNGRGEVVQCSDGKWSHSGGLAGACADHGGEKGAAPAERNPPPERSEDGGGGEGEGPGSLSHAEDAQFCSSHECIANFSNGHGEVVQCTDGEWSHSGGISGACSGHGGEGTTGGGERTSPAESTESPINALNSYWSDIRTHDFSGAYGYLVPGTAGISESQFVSSEGHTGISSVNFEGDVTSSSSRTASVVVTELVTQDAEFGCRRWTGSYTMANEGGSWRIEHAAIIPHSCSG